MTRKTRYAPANPPPGPLPLLGACTDHSSSPSLRFCAAATANATQSGATFEVTDYAKM